MVFIKLEADMIFFHVSRSTSRNKMSDRFPVHMEPETLYIIVTPTLVCLTTSATSIFRGMMAGLVDALPR